MFTVRAQHQGFSGCGFRDIYEFPTSFSEEESLEIISRVLVCSVAGRSYDGSYTFRRGSRFWTWLSMGPEKWPLQEISVRFDDGQVTLSYQIIGGIWIRFGPCELEKEARSIASRLKEAES